MEEDHGAVCHPGRLRELREGDCIPAAVAEAVCRPDSQAGAEGTLSSVVQLSDEVLAGWKTVRKYEQDVAKFLDLRFRQGGKGLDRRAFGDVRRHPGECRPAEGLDYVPAA